MASKSKATSLNPDDVLAEILRRRPQFKQASDALVFALMTSMRLQGFQVVALDERSDAARTGERGGCRSMKTTAMAAKNSSPTSLSTTGNRAAKADTRLAFTLLR